MLRNAYDRAYGKRMNVKAGVGSIVSARNPNLGLYGDDASSYGMGFGQSNRISRMYSQSSRGVPYSAIRPIAVKVSSLPYHVGFIGEAESQDSKAVREKHLSALQREKSFRNVLSLENASVAWVKGAARQIQVDETHPFLSVLARPNGFQSGASLIYCTSFSLEAVGQALWLLDTNESDQVTAIYYMPRHWMVPIPGDDGNPFGKWKLQLPNRVASDDDVIDGRLVVHFIKPDPANPADGHSATEAQQLAIETDNALQRSQYFLTQNMARPSVVITMGEGSQNPMSGQSQRPRLTPEQRDQILASFMREYSMATKHGRPIVLDEIIQDVKPFLPTPAELDGQSSTKMTHDRIMEGYGTHPLIINSEGGNRAQAYVAQANFSDLQINPNANLISETATFKLRAYYGENFVFYIEKHRPDDVDLQQKRVELAVGCECVTKGQLKRYAATGEFVFVPADDDDEIAKKPAGGAGGGMPPADQADGEQAGAKALSWFDSVVESVERSIKQSGKRRRRR